MEEKVSLKESAYCSKLYITDASVPDNGFFIY